MNDRYLSHFAIVIDAGGAQKKGDSLSNKHGKQFLSHCRL